MGTPGRVVPELPGSERPGLGRLLSGSVHPRPAGRRSDVLSGLTRALLAVAALLAGAWVYARLLSPVAYFGTPQRGEVARTFAATDQDGRPFDLSSTRGQVVALFFGFTHCPNICPLTLSYLEKARTALPTDLRDDLRVVFVTLDPARDRPEQIGPYVRAFGPDIVGLYVPEPRLASVAKAYDVTYAKADVRSEQTYFINHSTATYVLDREGRLRLIYDYTQMPQFEKVSRDLAQIMKEN